MYGRQLIHNFVLIGCRENADAKYTRTYGALNSLLDSAVSVPFQFTWLKMIFSFTDCGDIVQLS